MCELTVLLPVFNSESYLKEAVESILNQTFKNFKLIIINDGSTDRSKEIIEKFNDSRILLLENDENKGLIYSLNKGLKCIDTKYMVRMDSDDISHPDRMRRLLEYMEEDEEIGICGTKVGDFSENRVSDIANIDDDKLRAVHLLNCSITHASAMYRMDIINRNNLIYHERYKHSEDNDFITNVLSVSKGAILNQNLYWVRKHDDQVSSRFRDFQKRSSTKRRVELLNEVFGVNLHSEEIKLYQTLSYKEPGLNSGELYDLGKLVLKLERVIIANDDFEFDRKEFLKLLYRRLDIIYLKHSSLGMSVFVNYLRQFLLNRQTRIGARLFIKSLIRR
ncbi:glycosyltransferase family 2 protein [Echinicola rosea]|uniref:Glycosyl transferase n=1 Tax=Echinicola rosea TaxID=1807691 RepID=A0ABQ1V9P7_9BACT|nr:glycosyltransferase family 2 protein [Echinicola rosea]GGF46996.1 glycosyl transferase [Echinicola rosea]